MRAIAVAALALGACASAPEAPPDELLARAGSASLMADDESAGLALELFVQTEPPPRVGEWFWVAGAAENRSFRPMYFPEFESGDGDVGWLAAQRFQVALGGGGFVRLPLRYFSGASNAHYTMLGASLDPAERYVFASRFRVRPDGAGVDYVEPAYDLENPEMIRTLELPPGPGETLRIAYVHDGAATHAIVSRLWGGLEWSVMA